MCYEGNTLANEKNLELYHSRQGEEPSYSLCRKGGAVFGNHYVLILLYYFGTDEDCPMSSQQPEPTNSLPAMRSGMRALNTIVRKVSPVSFNTILYEEDGPIGTITLNRPEDGNMFTAEMCHEIRDCINDIRRETRTRVIVITGAGDKFFCIGGRKDGMEDTTL